MNNAPQILISIFLSGIILLISSEDSFGYQVAIVKSRQLEPYEQAVNGIRKGIEESKEDVKVVEFNLEGKSETGYEIAQEILTQKFHLVFAIGTEASHALHHRIQKIPLIVTMMYDPANEFEVAKKEEPSLYGIPLKVPMRTQLSLMNELAPEFKVLSAHCGALGREDRNELQQAIEEQHMTLECVNLDESKEISAQLKKVKAKSNIFFLILPRNPYHKSMVQELLASSVRQKFPVIGFTPAHVSSGALMSFSYQFEETGLEAARLGIQILNGTQITKRFRYIKKVLVSWNQNVSKILNVPIPQRKDIQIEIL